MIKTYRKEFSTLSVSLQPIEKEFAYYLTKDKVKGGFWKQLVLAYNVWDTRRHRKEFNDDFGVKYYSEQLKLFCMPVRIYILIIQHIYLPVIHFPFVCIGFKDIACCEIY